jgi:hypothetical protein
MADGRKARSGGTSLDGHLPPDDRKRANSCEKDSNSAFFRFIATSPAGMV